MLLTNQNILEFLQDDSLDIRSQKTYIALDSIAIKEEE
jgi:hypothetical protein